MKKIETSDLIDVDEILSLYELATKLMRSKGVTTWPIFERGLVEGEIKDHRQWKLLIDDEVACVWAITFNDEQIWQERSNDHSIYIHRIATNPNFKGQDLVQDIVSWAKSYAAQNDKRFIRLDTVGPNEGLVRHYEKCGFNYLGMFKLNDTVGLPAHYQNASVCLFEIKL